MKIWRNRSEAWFQTTKTLKARYICADDKGMAIFVEMEPNSDFPKHRHPQVTYGIIIKGSGTYRAENGEFPLTEGDMYYIGSNEEHWLLAGGGGLSLIEFLVPIREELINRVVKPDVE